jgi:hypothetical protein
MMRAIERRRFTAFLVSHDFQNNHAGGETQFA